MLTLGMAEDFQIWVHFEDEVFGPDDQPNIQPPEEWYQDPMNVDATADNVRANYIGDSIEEANDEFVKAAARMMNQIQIFLKQKDEEHESGSVFMYPNYIDFVTYQQSPRSGAGSEVIVRAGPFPCAQDLIETVKQSARSAAGSAGIIGLPTVVHVTVSRA